MKLFVDCGTHLFQGLKHFNTVYSFDDDWEIYSFEANPYVYELSIRNGDKPDFKNLHHLNAAVSVTNGYAEVNIDMNNLISQGTNILKRPPATDGDATFNWARIHKVPCLDVVEFIDKRPCEYCVVKLDVEGAEFDILQKFIETDVVSKIDELYVEFHERFFTDNLEEYAKKREDMTKYCKEKVKKFETWF